MFIIVLLSIVIITVLLSINNATSNKNKIIYVEEIPLKSNIEKVSNRTQFFAVRMCIEKYYLEYATMFLVDNTYNSEIDVNKEEIQALSTKIVYDMLDEEYKNAKQITENNIQSKLEKINEVIVDTVNIYVSEKSNNISVYIVEGTLRDKITSEIKPFTVIVKQDAFNKTFTILPQDYVDEKYSQVISQNNIEINIPDEIEKNLNNSYVFNIISDEEYIMKISI